MTLLHAVCLAIYWLAYSVLAAVIEVVSTLPATPVSSVLWVLAAAVVLLAGHTYAPVRRQP